MSPPPMISSRLLHGLVILMLLASLTPAPAADTPLTVEAALRQPDAWFRSAAGRQAVANVLSHQSPRGDWPKNTNTAAAPFSGDRAAIRGTFDNGATTRELRLLNRARAAAPAPELDAAINRGLDHILAAQQPGGGWPQYAPPPADGYARHITFNDDVMRRLMELVRDVAERDDFAWLDPGRRARAGQAFRRGLDCILRCQVRVDGRLTVWCAQHDATTFEPRPARSFELASLSGSESAGLLLLLMDVPDPSPEIVAAVEAGVAWFKAGRIEGFREVRVDGDKRLVPDPAAPPLWARFYEIGSNRPIFAGRDGLKRHDYAEIEAERRNGYSWYGRWGDAVFARHAKWRPK